ncbi:MAG: hypothetical protein ACRCZP_16735 [Phycicoccus sp.]
MEQRKAGKGAPGVQDWRRQMAALAGQADDPEGLAQVLDISAALDVEIAAAVARLRGEGHSDAELGRALGVSRQAVTKRWPRHAVRCMSPAHAPVGVRHVRRPDCVDPHFA